VYKTKLTTSQLGQTGLDITRVGFGAWALGGAGKRYEWAWGSQDDGDSVAAIEHAVELGVNWIDTAAEYGLGHSEEVVGRALQGLQERPYVFTKAGRVAAGEGHIVSNLKRDSILREVEASRARLGVEAIDLYQIHWPTEDLEEGWATLAELKEEGLARHIGISNVDVEQLRRIQSIAPVETLQPPYSLVAREAEEELLPFAEHEGIGVIVYSPMGSGLLAGSMSRERLAGLRDNDWRKHDDRFREPRLSRGLAIAERLEKVAERLDTSPGAVAVAWTLRNPAVDGAIVGFRRPDQVDPIIAAASLELGEEDIATIEGRAGDGHDDSN
jgi:aryl-alcohol dehydrogenase-like predicted oxidoreductase